MAKGELPRDEFLKMFNEAVNVAEGKTEGMKEQSLMEVLEKYHMVPENLPKPLSDKIMPLLKAKPGEIQKAGPGCVACVGCALCVECALLDAAVLGAAVVGVAIVMEKE